MKLSGAFLKEKRPKVKLKRWIFIFLRIALHKILDSAAISLFRSSLCMVRYLEMSLLLQVLFSQLCEPWRILSFLRCAFAAMHCVFSSMFMSVSRWVVEQADAPLAQKTLPFKCRKPVVGAKDLVTWCGHWIGFASVLMEYITIWRKVSC